MSKRKRLSPAPFAPPPEAAPETAPAPHRRAPIADVAGDSAAMAALAEVSRDMERARAEGRLAMSLPLGAIRHDHLVRDRIAADEGDMEALVESLRARGQQMPIDVCDLGDGRYGLISGWRRCQALARLHEETGEARFGHVLAFLRQPGEATEAYRAMVEENEIRAGLSYYERARIVVKAVEQGVFETEQTALRELFATASRAKRSKIGSFADIVRALDGVLRFPRALGERAGLKLARALGADPALSGRVTDVLRRADPADAEAELAVLDRMSISKKPSKPAASKPRPRKFRPRPGIEVEIGAGGRITIHGKAVDKALHEKLLAFLMRPD